MVTIERSGSECRLTLAGELTIFQAQALFDELAPLFEEGSVNQNMNFSIDLAQVSKIDSSIIQILMMARKHWLDREQQFNLINHSEVVINALEILGLVAWFKDPIVIREQREQQVVD